MWYDHFRPKHLRPDLTRRCLGDVETPVTVLKIFMDTPPFGVGVFVTRLKVRTPKRTSGVESGTLSKDQKNQTGTPSTMEVDRWDVMEWRTEDWVMRRLAPLPRSPVPVPSPSSFSTVTRGLVLSGGVLRPVSTPPHVRVETSGVNSSSVPSYFPFLYPRTPGK